MIGTNPKHCLKLLKLSVFLRTSLLTESKAFGSVKIFGNIKKRVGYIFFVQSKAILIVSHKIIAVEISNQLFFNYFL